MCPPEGWRWVLQMSCRMKLPWIVLDSGAVTLGVKQSDGKPLSLFLWSPCLAKPKSKAISAPWNALLWHYVGWKKCGPFYYNVHWLVKLRKLARHWRIFWHMTMSRLTDNVSGHSGRQLVRPLWSLPGSKVWFSNHWCAKANDSASVHELMLLEAFKLCVKKGGACRWVCPDSQEHLLKIWLYILS